MIFTNPFEIKYFYFNSMTMKRVPFIRKIWRSRKNWRPCPPYIAPKIKINDPFEIFKIFHTFLSTMQMQ